MITTLIAGKLIAATGVVLVVSIGLQTLIKSWRNNHIQEKMWHPHHG